MAEFQEVMKQTKRMCNSMASCDRCPMPRDDVELTCPMCDCVGNAKEYERIVMDWAAEHPEKEELTLENVDMINHPNHYQLSNGKDCFDVMVEMFGKEAVQTYCVLNAFTYLFRHARKNGKEDVLKAEYNLAKYKELEGDDR